MKKRAKLPTRQLTEEELKEHLKWEKRRTEFRQEQERVSRRLFAIATEMLLICHKTHVLPQLSANSSEAPSSGIET